MCVLAVHHARLPAVTAAGSASEEMKSRRSWLEKTPGIKAWPASARPGRRHIRHGSMTILPILQFVPPIIVIEIRPVE